MVLEKVDYFWLGLRKETQHAEAIIPALSACEPPRVFGREYRARNHRDVFPAARLRPVDGHQVG
jgi:hypothetical protein